MAYLKSIGFTLTPSADDIYTEIELDLPVQPLQGVGLAIERLEIEYPAQLLNADGNYAELSLHFTPQSSMPTINNEQVITKVKKVHKFTTSGQICESLVDTITWFPAPLIVKNKIYAGIRVKAGAPYPLRIKIGYTNQRVSNQQISQIVMDQFL